MKKYLLLVMMLLSLLCAAVFAACGGNEDNAVKYRISVGEIEGGSITCSLTEAAAGETVTVTCTPDDGFVFKDGTLQVNGVSVQGNSFTMPEEDVVVTGEFVREDYKGVYVCSKILRDGIYMHDFIQVGESTLTVGVTIATYEANFDYAIYENVPYEVQDFKLIANVNDEAWSAEIGNGVLFCGASEYVLSNEAALSGTYTEIAEQGNGFIERDYTFSNGTFVCTTYFEDGSSETENATYKQYGGFLFIEEPDSPNETNRIKYGVVKAEEDGLVFLYNYHAVRTSGEPYVISDLMNLYPKSEQEITLKESGAYILKESVNPYNGEAWDEPKCFDFLAMRNGELAFSRHGVYYNGDLHYFGENTDYLRFGNVLKVSYTFDDQDFNLVFHILDANTLLIKDTANSLQKFVFTENSVFEGGYGAAYSNSDSSTYSVSYYEEGKFGEKEFDKQTDALVKTSEYGAYKVYGDILVRVQNGGEVDLGTIAEQDSGSECDYLYEFNTIWSNGICEGVQTERIRNELGGRA